MTRKQKIFCEEYLKCGNGAEAARMAGYSEKAARQTADENLSKPDISAYLAERMREQDAKLVADANEVIQFYTAVMRGEVKDQFGLDSSLADRLKAADALMKRHNAAGTAMPGHKVEDDPLTKALREVAESLAGQ